MDKELIGKTSKFTVLRETKIGYMLEKDGYEYFLHKNECENRFLKNEEEVDAFLYFDNQKRLAATLKLPFIEVGKAGLLKVKSANYPLGVFLDNNISKDLLLSGDLLPLNEGAWPQAGDWLLVRLKKTSKQLKAIIKKEDFKKPEIANVGDKFKGYLVLYVNNDFYLANQNLEAIKIKKDNYLNKQRLGSLIEAKIIYKGFNEVLGEVEFDKDEYFKEKKRDMYKLLLKNRDNLDLNFYTKEYVEKKLKISNKKFKKIISLLKDEGLIDIKDKKIILKGDK